MTTLTHQKAVHASYLLGAVALVIMPDVFAGLIMEVLHLVFELMHLAFEFLEVALDHLVEHLFHTGVHETQVIVFYTIVSMGAVAGFFILRSLRHFLHNLKISAAANYLDKKNHANIYWQSQSLIGKAKFVAVGSVGIAFIVLFGF